MRFCFQLIVVAFAAFGLHAASMDPQPRVAIKTIVRADANTGRLVRSSIIAARVIPEKVISAVPPPPPAVPHPAIEPGATVNALVATIARRQGVEPSLVDSVIRVESNYNPNAISPKGAMGL